MTGTAYPLHPEPGLPNTAARVARAYPGFAAGAVADRVAQHLTGRGSPLEAAVIAAGATATVERTRPGVDRNFERALKRRTRRRGYAPAASAPVTPTHAACCSNGWRR